MRLRLYCITLLITQLLGCTTTSMLAITDNDIATVLQPISKSNIVDDRSRFRELFCKVNKTHSETLANYRFSNLCDGLLHLLVDEPPLENSSEIVLENRLKNRLKVVVIPGMLNECVVDDFSPFSNAIKHLRKEFDIDISVLSEVRGRASSKHNSSIIFKHINNIVKGDRERVIIVGYSKGVTDLLFYLSDFNYKTSHSKIDAVVSVAGVVNGTPIADDIGTLLKSVMDNLPYDSCPIQDESGVEDLTREKQLLRLGTRSLPSHIQYYSLAAYSEINNISSILKPFHRKLSVVDPRNDGQVIYFDSIIPNSRLLGFANCDHWAVALPIPDNKSSLSFIHRMIANQADRNEYPREVLLESIIRFVDSNL